MPEPTLLPQEVWVKQRVTITNAVGLETERYIVVQVPENISPRQLRLRLEAAKALAKTRYSAVSVRRGGAITYLGGSTPFPGA